MKLINNSKFKRVSSKDYNYHFIKDTGFFARWGDTLNDDPEFAPMPEIADVEITTKCNGVNGKVCQFCYKSNTPEGYNMSLDTFKNVFQNINQYNTLTQIAFGADSQATTNPDLFPIMEYCRENGVIPNITVAQIDDTVAKKLSELCGAVAVSRYAYKDACYDSVNKLTYLGMKQVNIHQMISQETYEQTLETINDIGVDERLDELNAIVFLSLKKRGRGIEFNTLTQEQFDNIVKLCFEKGIRFGFDSCSAPKFVQSIENLGLPNKEQLLMCTEPCESSTFSIYINHGGKAYPCSFAEGIGKWKDGIDCTKIQDFQKEVWNGKRFKEFRRVLSNKKDCNNCRKCQLFEV